MLPKPFLDIGICEIYEIYTIYRISEVTYSAFPPFSSNLRVVLGLLSNGSFHNWHDESPPVIERAQAVEFQN